MKPKSEKKKGPAQIYLERIKWLDVMIDSKLEELCKLDSMVHRITPVMNTTGAGNGSGSQDKHGDAIAKIIDLQREINQDNDEFIDLRREAGELLKRISKPEQYQVLHKRYVLYERFENIAVEMKYSYRHICNIHGRALQAFEKVLEEHRHMQKATKDMLFVQLTKAAGGGEK